MLRHFVLLPQVASIVQLKLFFARCVRDLLLGCGRFAFSGSEGGDINAKPISLAILSKGDFCGQSPSRMKGTQNNLTTF
jgi:hypothetical protein